MNKIKLIFLISLMLFLSSCSLSFDNNNTEEEQGYVFINKKEISDIIFNDNVNNDLPESLIGVWLTDNGSWCFYNDGTYLVQAFMQDVGSWFTSGTWSVSDNMLNVTLNSYNKKEEQYDTKEYKYNFELENDMLHITSEEDLVDIVFKKYVDIRQ